jgi:acetylornithine deacetylase
LNEGPPAPGVVQQLTFFLDKIRDFADQRRAQARPHPLYADTSDPVPVNVTKIITGPWGTREPITTPEECRIEIYWQAMPGETVEDIDGEFMAWIGSLSNTPGSPFVRPPKVEFPSRWLPGSAIAKEQPLVVELAGCATRVMGRVPPLAGIEGPCDMYVFHSVTNTPAVLWGARGGNTHAADEYVEIDTLVEAAKVLLVFVHKWCSASN